MTIPAWGEENIAALGAVAARFAQIAGRSLDELGRSLTPHDGAPLFA
ncbi:hypothetical protein [Leifsonia sp. Root4]|nr:hypothetical protein [Leifsonia sp. Root4]